MSKIDNYDIAIIGMGCVFPEANSTEEYWTNILSGNEYVKDMPEHLWPMKQFWSAERMAHKSVTIKGSFLKDFDFNPIEYGIPPKNLEGVDRAQLVAIEAVRQALSDAGIKPKSAELENAVTVIGASGVDEFAHVALYLNRLKFFKKFGSQLKAAGLSESEQEALFEEFSQALKDRGHNFHPSVTSIGAIVSSLSNRIAQVFGVKGFNMSVDGACASSFVALNTACHALMAGDAKIAVAGGVDLGINPAIYIGFSRLGGLSPNGASNPFDNNANGLVIGEGGGVVILKRLEDAVADGDEIKAVIRGIGTTSDGAGQAIYNPSVEQRSIALKKAFKSADIDSAKIQFLEAHATSTVVGDANEYDAISTAYGDREASNPLYLGTVKHQIGHLKAAAGMAGLIKTVLAMNAGKIPHMPRFRKLTELATKQNDALIVNNEVLDWAPREDGSRYAAVTASGFGGVNYHTVLEQAPKYKLRKRPVHERDMAIVGIVNRYPGAANPQDFWNNLLSGKENFQNVDADKLGWEENIATGPVNERIGTRKIALIDDYDINYLRLKITPNSISQTSPAQLLSVEMSDRLLSDYGYELKAHKNIGVSIGSMHDDNYATISYPLTADEYGAAMRQSPTFSRHADKLEGRLQETIEQVVADGPPHTEATLPGWMSNVNSGIVANRLNCNGPNFTVDTACSSGLASMVPAMYQLMFSDVDAMIAGGLNRHTTNVFATAVDRLGAIAVDTAKPFDKDGMGFLAGEGGALYLLKRLKDAKADKDKIYGIIHNVAGSSEYKSKSMIAPTEDALRFAIEEGMKNVSIKPEEIGVVDTHGSANRLSDICEVGAIAKALRPGTGAPPVHVTAVKSHVGHSYGGSGAAGILSVLGTLNGRQVPGIRHLDNYRPEIEGLLDKARPQKGTAPLEKEFISGGVTSLGLGGANFFVVLSAGDEGIKNAETGNHFEVPEPEPKTETLTAPAAGGAMGTAAIDGVLKISGSDIAAIRSAVSRRLDSGETVINNSSNLCLTVSYDSEATLKTKLTTVLKFLESNADLRPLENQGVYLIDTGKASAEKLTFCFPGQGTHYIGMGRFLYETRPEFREVVDTINKLAKADFGFDLIEDLYGDMDPQKAATLLGGLDGAQISLFAVEVGLARVYSAMGVVPDLMVGHSFGEISALAAQGVWSLEDGYKVVAARIRAAQNGGQGLKLKMLSIACSDQQKDALLSLAGNDVVLSNINAPGQFILAGKEEMILKIAETAETLGIEARVLAIGSAFHSKFMEDAVEPFRNALRVLPCRQPAIPIMSTITKDYISFKDSEELAKHLSLQLTTQLDMPTVINNLYNDGSRHFLEVGPKWAVTNYIKAILKDRDIKAVPSLHPKIGDEETFRRAITYLTGLNRIGGSAAGLGSGIAMDTAFMAYLQSAEPAVISLLNEAHRRFMGAGITAVPAPSAPAPAPAPAIADKPAAAPAPATPAPAAVQAAAQPTAPSAPAADMGTWVARSKSALAESTGYPEDMLGEELDLEADLGIDSVQRAEIWGRMTSEFGIDPEARPTSIRTITELAGELSRLSGDASGNAAPAQPAAAPGAPAADMGTWVARSKSALAESTGYPEDMLGEELDLEADLGIDSVQRAEIWGKMTSEFGIDPEARPTSIRTITELAGELSRLSGDSSGTGAPAPAAAQPSAAAPAADMGTWVARSKSALAESTGYPEDMLGEELDLEADLGIDSVQRAEIWGKMTSEFGIDPEARPTSIRTITELAGELSRLSGPAPAAAVAETPAPAQTSAAPAADMGTWVARSKSALAESTGYPEDMLGEELDLEADLGIDSVQRAEIWGKMTSEFGIDPEARPTSIRTITELAGELSRLSAPAVPSASAASAGAPAQAAAQTAGTEQKEVNRLFYSGYREMTKDEIEAFSCSSLLVITADAKASKSWTERLENKQRALTVRTNAEIQKLEKSGIDELLKGVDSILYLGHGKVVSSKAAGVKLSELLMKETDNIYKTFRAIAPTLRESSIRLICPISQDGAFGADTGEAVYQGAFPAGFMRTLSYEIPEVRFQIVDTGKLSWADAAEKLISTAFKGLEAGLLDGQWIKPSIRTVAPDAAETSPLEKGDLVLVTGGARGIVFECVYRLAKKTGCRLLLTGRTEPAEGNEEWLSADDNSIDDVLRSLEIKLVKEEGMNLGDAKRYTNSCRSKWEVSRNLQKLSSDGIEAVYKKCDVSSRDSLKALIDEINKDDKIRGVVHGAGVQKSKLFEDLKDDAIALTMKTKMVPLFLLQDLLDFSELRLFSAFGSIAGLFGNAGQSDYALANDMLASAVTAIGQKEGIFSQTVEWTAWSGTGMVTDAESKRFKEAGLDPVTVEDGTKLYLQAVLSTRLPRLAAFNKGAAFTGQREISSWTVPGNPTTSLREKGADCVVFDMSRDVYIEQHLVRHEPVVPGTFTTEVLSEYKTDDKKVLKDIGFRRPVRVRDGRIEVEVIEQDGRMIVLPKDRPAIEGPALMNLSFASATLGAPKKIAKKDLPGFSKKVMEDLISAAKEQKASFYTRLDERHSDSLITGPVFRGVCSTLEADGFFYSLLRLTDDAAKIFAVPGDFIINPVMADMAIQAGAAWSMLRHDVMAIPYSIGELRVYKAPETSETVAVCREIEITPEEAKMDIIVREPDGSLVFTMSDVVLKTISGKE